MCFGIVSGCLNHFLIHFFDSFSRCNVIVSKKYFHPLLGVQTLVSFGLRGGGKITTNTIISSHIPKLKITKTCSDKAGHFLCF